jgi:hypothetical protein
VDFINGRTEDIETFAARILPPKPDTITQNMDTSTCPGLMAGCKVFMERDLAAFDEMAKFLTDVAQGMAAYKQIALACVADYLRGDSESAQGVASRVNNAADQQLDDMADAYEAKRPPAPWVKPPPRLY